MKFKNCDLQWNAEVLEKFKAVINIGDTFEFGNYNNKPIKWKVLSKYKDSIYVISCESLCEREFRDVSYDDFRSGKVTDANEWEKSDLRKWLNGEFYDEAFSNEEKNMIKSDKVTLLTKEEAVILMTEEERKRNTCWWLQSPYHYNGNYVWYVDSDGIPDISNVIYSGGVCPTLHLKFSKEPTMAEVPEAVDLEKLKAVMKEFNIGDTFDFGNYDNKLIKWKVLSKDKDSIFVISCESLCKHRIGDDRNEVDVNQWEKSYLRKWLNGEFYDEAFSNGEKDMIRLTDSDKVTLLTKEEAETLMTKEERKRGMWWWLRSTYPYYNNYFWSVYGDGSFVGVNACSREGICPVLHLKF